GPPRAARARRAARSLLVHTEPLAVELRPLLVFLCGCTSFQRLPTFNDGGVSTTPEALADRRAHPQDLVVHEGSVFWVDQGSFSNSARDGQLLKAPAAGCPDNSCPEVLAQDLYSPGGVTLSLDGANLYFAELGAPLSGRVWQITFGSNETPALFAMGQDGPT